MINRSPTTLNLGKISPFSQFVSVINHLNNPHLDLLHAFGTISYIHIPHKTHPRSQKSDNRAHKGHLMGYTSDNTYHVWISQCNGVICFVHIQFDDTLQWESLPQKFVEPLSTELEDLEEIVDTIILVDTVPNALPILSVTSLIAFLSSPFHWAFTLLRNLLLTS